jgi:L-ribulose-5-phosphate 4-epimerase
MPHTQETETRQMVVNLAQDFLKAGLVVRTWGNFSARLDKDTFVITPSGKAYEGMQTSELVTVATADGKPLEEGSGKPSSESPMHARVYQRYPEMKVVAHTHQVYASALTLLGTDIDVPEKWQSILGATRIPLSDYALPGSRALHNNMAETLARSDAQIVLMGRHGAFILAETATECLRLAEDMERFCTEVYAERLGKAITHRPDIQSNNDREKSLAQKWQKTTQEGIAVSADSEVLPWLSGTLSPYLDDFAQICGVSVSQRRGSASVVFDPAAQVAICFGKDEADAKNVRAVLEKNARAANVARLSGQKPIPAWESLAMRLVYQLKYSKQANR